MDDPRPAENGILAQSHFVLDTFTETAKKNVNRDHICVEAINPRGINQVRNNSPAAISPASHVIGQKPPQVSEQIRPRQSVDSMPNHAAKVDILDAHAVDVKFVLVLQT